MPDQRGPQFIVPHPSPGRTAPPSRTRSGGAGSVRALASAARCARVTYPLWSAKPYSGIALVQGGHDPSLVTFATIDAAATQAATWSPFQIARDGAGRPRHREAVDEYIPGLAAQPGDGAAHPGDVAPVQPAGVDLDRRDDHDVHGPRRRHDALVQLLPPRGCDQLGVGEPVDLPPQDDRGDHQRSRRRRPAPPRRPRRSGTALAGRARARSRRSPNPAGRRSAAGDRQQS